jgi:hypothetical protein
LVEFVGAPFQRIAPSLRDHYLALPSLHDGQDGGALSVLDASLDPPLVCQQTDGLGEGTQVGVVPVAHVALRKVGRRILEPPVIEFVSGDLHVHRCVPLELEGIPPTRTVEADERDRWGRVRL